MPDPAPPVAVPGDGARRPTPGELTPVGTNVEIVRQAFDAFSRRDLSALLLLVDPQIEFVPATARMAGRSEPYRGHEGLRAYMADVGRVWQELRSEPDEMLEVGERVVCVGRVYAWGVGRVIDSPAGWVWRVRDGLLVEGRTFDTRRAAFESVGLPWPPPAAA